MAWVNSPTAPPEYFNPCDIFKLCAARGDFTVDSDRDAVNDTLTKMLRAKVEQYAKEDITLSRLMQVFAPVFVPRHAYGSAALASEGGSALGRYQKVVVGGGGLLHLIYFEICRQFSSRRHHPRDCHVL